MNRPVLISDERGFTLLEILITLIVLSIGLVGMAKMQLRMPVSTSTRTSEVTNLQRKYLHHDQLTMLLNWMTAQSFQHGKLITTSHKLVYYSE